MGVYWVAHRRPEAPCLTDGPMMIRFAVTLLLAVLWTSGPALAADPLTPRETQLKGIAASCASFYQIAFFELDLPVEGNEEKRQTYLAVHETLGKRGKTDREYDVDFQREIMARVIEITTILEKDPEVARTKVLGNLPKCDALIPELKAAAGLD